MTNEEIGTNKESRYSEQSYAAHPTKYTMFWRKFWPWQIYRFFALNLMVMKIVIKGHS